MIDIYRASCENVKEIKKQAKTVKRLFNQSLRNHRWSEAETLTKTYALLYSAYAEVSFLKVIHTPCGFTEDYIKQIQDQRNLEEKWLKCLDLAFLAISNTSNNTIMNQKLKLRRILDKYIIEPSHIRNKIAHGQWKQCLNSNSTGINSDITNKVRELDFVKIDILFNVYNKFSDCIEDLIESPYRAHFRYFYAHCVELDGFISRTASYSTHSKSIILESSPKNRKQH